MGGLPPFYPQTASPPHVRETVESSTRSTIRPYVPVLEPHTHHATTKIFGQPSWRGKLRHPKITITKQPNTIFDKAHVKVVLLVLVIFEGDRQERNHNPEGYSISSTKSFPIFCYQIQNVTCFHKSLYIFGEEENLSLCLPSAGEKLRRVCFPTCRCRGIVCAREFFPTIFCCCFGFSKKT